ncbi:SAGA-associated factor 73 [Diplogelasinospora grovesii]|uniref:SAGA-associated factor 73 n=1 Tax=Diplogelasinospora grovesii TaxID=303347 RepID=A0AAN6N8I3_9PEZI|nr:SAGA-associated factor 73 [Diplogelasinospora grovesii]
MDGESTIKVASSTNNRKMMMMDSSGKKIRLKQAVPKHVKPGNWKEASILEEKRKALLKEKENAMITATGSPSPIVNVLEEPHRETFATGRPLEDIPDLQQCKHCKKSVLRIAAKEHIAQCLRIKKEKAQRKKEAREARERAKEAAQQKEEEALARKNGIVLGQDDNASLVDGKGDDDSDDDGDIPVKKVGAGKTASKVGGKKTDGLSGKKRKADGDLKEGKNKKKKDEPKPKAAKPVRPVDVEKQCGVPLANGLACARSLTCKSHSMGAKRAVPGRSLPYDMLLAAYQKKNQAKQQKAAIDANAPLEDEDERDAAAVDSDEETAAVMTALAHWNPQPVVPQPVLQPIKRQYQLARLHEQLQTATNGGRVNIFKVVGFGAQRLPDGHPGLYGDGEDAPGEPDITMPMSATGAPGTFSRRSSSSFSLSGAVPQQLPQRRPSVTSRA